MIRHLAIYSVLLVIAVNLICVSSMDNTSRRLQDIKWLLDNSQNKKAVADLNIVIGDNPNNVLALNYRSLALARTGQFKEALVDANQAIRLRPHETSARINKARILFKMSKYREALAESNFVLSLEPNESAAFAIRGLIYEASKDYNKALKEFCESIRLAPGASENYNYRGTIYRKLKSYRLAIQDFNKAIVLNPHDAIYYNNRGFALLESGEVKYAIQDYSAAIRISPKDADGYLLRADAYEQIGFLSKRISDLTSAIQILPKQAEIYERRAYSYLQLGKCDLALADSSKSMALAPSSTRSSKTAASIFEAKGDLKKAIECRTKLLNAEKTFFDLHRRSIDAELIGRNDIAKRDQAEAYKIANPKQRLLMMLERPLSRLGFPPASNQNNIEILKSLKPIVLPFRRQKNGLCVVPLTVNGYTSDFLLDTGCEYSIIFEDNKGLSRKTNASFDSSEVHQALLKMGSVEFSNVSLEIYKNPYNNDLGGILGGNLLKYFCVRIDNNLNQVVLSTSPHSIQKNAFVVPVSMIWNNQIYCDVKLNKTFNSLACLDTGATCNTSVSTAILEVMGKKKLIMDQKLYRLFVGLTQGGLFEVASLQMANLRTGKTQFIVYKNGDTPIELSAILLGNTFFEQFKTVTFDYLSRQIIFEK